MGVTSMNYIINVTVSTSYYNRANIHYSQIIQYERILVTAEYWQIWHTHNRHLLTPPATATDNNNNNGLELDPSDMKQSACLCPFKLWVQGSELCAFDVTPRITFRTPSRCGPVVRTFSGKWRAEHHEWRCHGTLSLKRKIIIKFKQQLCTIIKI